ncbi:MAG: HAD family hydrolase [Spirochaetota bacterium]
MAIKAIAFDVDGTLYPNSVMYLKSLPFVLTHLRFMLAYSAVRKEIRLRRPVDDLRSLEESMLAERLGISPEAARARIEKDIYGAWEAVLDRVAPYPHVRSCLERLREAGYPIAVTSDFPVERKLPRLGLDDLFDCRLWTEVSGYLKPHPEPFLQLAGCLGVPPEEILYVGNSYEYDVEGAKRAGMMAAHLTRRPPPGSIADFSFSDYRDLCSWVLGS